MQKKGSVSDLRLEQVADGRTPLRIGQRSSTRVGIVQRLFRINGAEAIGQHQTDAKLTIRPLWQRDGWDGWAYGPSATPLEEGTCSDVASAVSKNRCGPGACEGRAGYH